MNDDVVEKVVRAICEEQYRQYCQNKHWEDAKDALEGFDADAIARAAIAAYEAAVGNLINIDQVAISRAMAICGFGGSVLDAARIAEALRGLVPAAAEEKAVTDGLDFIQKCIPEAATKTIGGKS